MPENKAYIKRFVDDERMSEAVHDFFKHVFLRSPKDKSVQSLAAAWMARELFEDAWRELLSYRVPERREKVERNIGV